MKKTNWHEIQIPNDGKPHQISIDGKKLCAVFDGESLYVISLKCPHAGANLAHGWCENGHIVCPFHRHKFDLKTGKGLKEQGNYVNTYPTRSENGIWQVGIEKPLWKKWF